MQTNLFDIPDVIIANLATFKERDLRAAVISEVSYVTELLKDFITTKRSLLSNLQMSSEIWIKPNITNGENPADGKTSQPLILDCLLNVIRDLSLPSKRIVVADSSVIGTNTFDAAEKCGILDICEKYSVEFVDLRNTVVNHVNVRDSLAFDSLDIFSPFTKTDIFKINLAKLKSTYGSPAGLCLKNAKGVIPDDYKLAFHLKGVQRSLCDLSRVLTWNLAIIEGFPASELGIPVSSGLLVISTDAVLADVVGSMCAGIPLQETFHIKWLAEYFGIDNTELAGCEELKYITKFLKPLKYVRNGILELENKYGLKIENGMPCSSCIESLAKALNRFNNNAPKDIQLFMGADINFRKDGILGEHKPIFVGNCSFDGLGMALTKEDDPELLLQLWRNACKISGCPPTIDSMFQNLVKPNDVSDKQIQKIKLSERIDDAFEKRPLFSLMSASKMKDLIQIIPHEETSFEELGLEMHLAGEVICAAICHQMNWGFLRNRIKIHIMNKSWWMPKSIGAIKKEDIEELLVSYEKTTRIRAAERAEMLRSLATVFKEYTSYTDIFYATNNNSRNHKTILDALNKCRVFVEDPQQKKMQVLFHNLSWANIVPGIENLCQPAIDYHIMRLYMRRGEVVPVSSIGEHYMCCGGQKKSKTVSAFRGIVAEAMRDVANYSKMPIHFINTIEWWMGRSVCLKNEPDCLLEKEKSIWLRNRYKKCPFYDNCLAIKDDWLLSISEPELSSRYY